MTWFYVDAADSMRELLERMTPTTLTAMYADLHECECDDFATTLDILIRNQLVALIGDEEAAEELDAVLNPQPEPDYRLPWEW